jgi:ribosomal protein L28
MKNKRKYEPNLKKAKIYKIVSNQTNKIYIGSTTDKNLDHYLATYRAKYKRYLNKEFSYVSAFDILKYDDAYIILIEDYPCKSRSHLLKREGYHITQNKDLCVNKYQARGSVEEAKKAYYIKWANKCHSRKLINKYSSRYYERHKDEINKRNKLKYNSLSPKQKKELNLKISIQRKKRIICDCGKDISYGSKYYHLTTPSHINRTTKIKIKIPNDIRNMRDYFGIK